MASSKNRQWLRRIKEWLGCEECGFGHPAALQFHHTGDKKADLHSLVRAGASRKALLAGIAKCRVLCANCHALAHDDENSG